MPWVSVLAGVPLALCLVAVPVVASYSVALAAITLIIGLVGMGVATVVFFPLVPRGA